jgi:hypothetical protein
MKLVDHKKALMLRLGITAWTHKFTMMLVFVLLVMCCGGEIVIDQDVETEALAQCHC